MPPYHQNSLDCSIHGLPNVVPLKDALDLSVHGLKHALDFSCHSTCHPQQNEFESILAIIDEGEQSLNLDEIMALFDEHKGDLPVGVEKFLDSRYSTFSRNMSLVHEQLQEHTEALLEALADEDEDPAEVLGDFMKDRVATFYRNMGTLSSLVLTGAAA